jgi:hypothetical protein
LASTPAPDSVGGVPDSEEIKRQMAQLQRELEKTEEALARLRKKIAGSDEDEKNASSKTTKRKSS